MARGPSGRIVVEVPPELKRRLHSRLAGDGRSLKGWFVEHVNAYLGSAEAERVDVPAVAPPRQPNVAPRTRSRQRRR